MRFGAKLAKAASISLLVLALTTSTVRPIASAPA